MSWRFSLYSVIAICGVLFVLALVFVTETHGPSILTAKAKRLRIATGNYALHSQQEMELLNLDVFLRRNLTRPITMMWTEPICGLIVLYNSFTYALLCTDQLAHTSLIPADILLFAIPIEFAELRGWQPVVATLPFFALAVGCVIATAYILWHAKQYYVPAFIRNRGRPVPELRLPPMLLGAVLLPGSVFWFAWTSGPDVNAASPVLALVFIGAGFLLVFQSGLN